MGGNLSGQVALVTGGRGGIGRATGARLTKEGTIVYAGDLSESGSLGDSAEGDTRFVRLERLRVPWLATMALKASGSNRFLAGAGSGGGGGTVETLRDAVRNVHPIRNYGPPADVANLVNWLAGDEARYASGQLWILDGGLSAQVQQMRL